MNKLALRLLSSSALLSSMLLTLLTINPAHSSEPAASFKKHSSGRFNLEVQRTNCVSCSVNTTNVDSTAIPNDRLNSPSETPMLDFTEEESDAAVKRFGCDCIACVNAIRQMRGLPPASVM